MPKAGTVYVDVESHGNKLLADIERQAQSAGRSLSAALGRSARTVIGDLGSSVASATKIVVGLGAAAVFTSAKFNKSMSGVGAVAGATRGELELLREAALDAGAATVFSASEAATAEAELARAGVEVSDILSGALMGSLDLAAAGQLELANAAEISAQALNIFNLRGDQTTHVADVLAAGANKSAADVGQLGDALRQGGLVASQYGINLETTVGVLAAFADRALIGSDAGTSLKTMLQRLSPISKESAQLMKELGFSAYDSTGNFVGLAGVADELQSALDGMTQQQRDTTLAQLFGSDAVRGANVLYELGAEGVREYTAAVDDQGAAQRMAATQLDNLSGDVEQFSGSIETALIRAGDLGDQAMREFVQGGTEAVNVFNTFATTPSWDTIQDRLGQLLDAGELTAGVGERIADAFERIDPADIDAAFDRIEAGRETLTGIREDLGGLTGLTAGIGASFVTMGLRSLPVIGQFAPALSPVTGILGGLLLGTQEGRDGLRELGGEMLDVARNAGPEVLDSLGEVADELGSGIGEAIGIVSPALADAATEILPLFADALADIAPAAAEFLTSGAELTAEVLPEFVSLLEAGAPVLGVITPALELGAGAMGIMADNADILVPLLAGLGAIKFAGFVRDLGLLTKLAGPLNAVTQPLTNLQGALAGTENLRRTTQFGIATKSVGGSLRSLATGASGATLALAAGTTALAMYSDMMQDAQRQGEDWGQSLRDNFDPAAANYAQLAAASGDLDDKMTQLNADMDDSFFGRNTVNKDFNEALSTGVEEAAAFQAEIDAMIDSANLLSGQIGTTRNQSLELIREQERLGDAFGTNAGLADTFRRELDKLTGGKLSAQEATIAYEQAVDDLSASLELNGANFNEADQAGRDNLNAVQANAEAAHEMAAAMVEENGNIMAATGLLFEHADGLRATLEAAGLTKEQIDELLETYGLMPDQIMTAVEVTGDQQAAAKVQRFQDRIEGLPDEVETYLQAYVDAGKLAVAERALLNLGRPRRVEFIPVGPGVGGGPIRVPEAAGGVLDFFAGGGFSENHVAQIAPMGSMRVWNEPETGGEAYIPLAPAKRGRSVDVWEETGERLGVAPRRIDQSKHVTMPVEIRVVGEQGRGGRRIAKDVAYELAVLEAELSS